MNCVANIFIEFKDHIAAKAVEQMLLDSLDHNSSMIGSGSSILALKTHHQMLHFPLAVLKTALSNKLFLIVLLRPITLCMFPPNEGIKTHCQGSKISSCSKQLRVHIAHPQTITTILPQHHHPFPFSCLISGYRCDRHNHLKRISVDNQT